MLSFFFCLLFRNRFINNVKQLFCTMKKTTNISPDKGRQPFESRKYKFDLDPVNYQCFISNSEKPLGQTDVASPTHDETTTSCPPQVPSSPISELRIPYIRRAQGLMRGDAFTRQFNTQVLLMQYDKQQVYTDSIKSQHQPEQDSKSVHSQASQQNQIVTSCLKMLNQQTDTQASSPPRLFASLSSQSHSQPQYYQQYSAYYHRQTQNNPQVNSFSIDLQKIEIDGRTTVMIRNIPNKYTENLLLELFNKNHKKKIDFFYLPVDFKNNCNVGYAFLNFIHPKFIVDFYNQFHNKKWKLFNSEKICHICYARIQGTYQLSHHFDTSRKLRQSQN